MVITYYNARDDGNGEIRGIRGGQYMKDLRTEKGIIMSKNIKVTMTAIFSMCILLVAAAGVKADSNLQQKTVHILTKQEKEQKQELQQIKKELTNHSKSYQKNDTEGETVEEQESALGKEQYDYSKAFRVQLVDDLMITAYKKKGKNIDKLFGDTRIRNPRIWRLFLQIVFEFLPKKSQMIIQADTVSRKTKCCDRIQKTCRQTT